MKITELKKKSGVNDMEKTTVIIERNNDGTFIAIPQHNHKIGFIGMGNTVESAMSDLQNSYDEAKDLFYAFLCWKSSTIDRREVQCKACIIVLRIAVHSA